MHAYHRMGADQTDSIAVCATKAEWLEVVRALDYSPLSDRESHPSGKLIFWLINQGVYDE